MPRLRIVCALMLIGFSAQAQDKERSSPLPQQFPLSTEACYGRVYDAQHLASHPKQRVTSFHLFRDFSPDQNAEIPAQPVEELRARDGDNGSIALSAYVRLRDKRGVYSNGFSCQRGEKGGVYCYIDCDGGSFDLKPSGDALLLDNKGFVVVGGCGASDEDEGKNENVLPGADDRQFRLEKQPVAQCVALRDAQNPVWAKMGPPLRTRFEAEKVCFTQTYDAQHLARHPAQLVRRIAAYKVARVKEGATDWPIYEFGFSVELKNGRKALEKTICSPDNYAYACSHIADNNTSQSFYLTRAGNERIMLRDRKSALGGLLGVKLGTDDRLFSLQAAPASACEF